jgi:Tol biopolymer transport system component/DNA-binding winged helix-turn-helix (wHTH) protein
LLLEYGTGEREVIGDFRIGEWVVQPRLNSVRNGDDVLRLEPKVMQVLVQLALRPNEVSTKDDLIQAVWPDTHVGEQVLTRCISELRRILHEDARSPRYIQNIPKVGYRLLVPVVPAEPADLPVFPVSEPQSQGVEPATPLSAHKQEGRSRPWGVRNFAWWAGAAILVAILLALNLLRKNPAPVNSNFRTMPFTSFPGSQKQPSFSPDGNEVAFVWSEQGEASNIFVKQIGSETPLRLTSGPARDLSPAWSPDGKSIVFIRQADGKNSVYLVPAIGGSERKVYEIHRPIDWDAPGLSWSPDGNWIVFPDAKSSEDPSAIYALSLKTLEARPLSAPPNSWDGDYGPVFSPDGKKIAFVRGADAAERNLYLMNADGSGIRQLTNEGRTVAGLAWTADGSGLVFSTDIGGSLALWRIQAAGGHAERLTVGGDNAVNPSISRRGNRLAYSQGTDQWSIVRVDLTSPAKPATQLFSSTEKDSAAQYSPDQSAIVFQSLRTGTQEIWTSKSDGSSPVELTSFNGPLTGSPSWSPDGTQIAFDSRSGGRSHIFVMKAEGGNPRALTSGDYNDVIPSWSQDGRGIYFGSRRSGRWEVWRVDLKSGEMQQVTTTGGFVAKESPDGKYLYYTKYHMAGLWRRSLKGGAEDQLLSGPPSAFWGYWSVTPSGIYWLNFQKTPVTVEFWDSTNGSDTQIYALPRKPPLFAGMTVSADGHWLLYSDEGDFGHNVRMVENFH